MVILDPITLLKRKTKILYFNGWYVDQWIHLSRHIFEEGFIIDIHEDLNHVTVTPNSHLINHNDIVSYFIDDMEISYPGYIERKSE
jgi:hypothetical protein